MYAYHATLKQNLKSIMEKGLLINQGSCNGEHNYYVENQLFFTFLSPQEAVDMVSSMLDEADMVYDYEEDIIVLRIPIGSFELDKIAYDYNCLCEDCNAIKTFAYKGNVSASLLEVVPKDNYKLVENTFQDLLHTDGNASDIGEKLLDIWEEKISYLYEKESDL